MRSGAELRGASCADLLPIAIDHYLTEPRTNFARRTGKAICSRCPVQMECRFAALGGPVLRSGIVGGVTANELNTARSWQSYEAGDTETLPRRPRPDWLPMSEAAQMVESLRVEQDPDEAGDQL